MFENSILQGRRIITGLLAMLSEHVSVSHSQTVLAKGKTWSRGHEQETRSLDLFGRSLDIQVGDIPSLSEASVELIIGPLGKHGIISAGVFLGEPDGWGGYTSGGFCLHFGLGIGPPMIDLSGTFPEKKN